MYIVYLSLNNFRNYTRLELPLPQQHVVIYGDNAQGKTNLLEAIYLLSTTKSYRTGNEKELINWAIINEPNSALRVQGNIRKEQEELKIEVALRCDESSLLQKRIRVNTIPRRASEVVGQANMVMFEAQDSQLTSGPAALRRRYLDLISSQIDRRYLSSLQRYNRVLTQRNHLLRLINEGQARSDEMEFWDNELVQNGVYLISYRQQIIAGINKAVQSIYRNFSSDKETLQIKYLPRIQYDNNTVPEQITVEITRRFQEQLEKSHGQEIAAGVTLVGPHRDDLRFFVNDIDIGTYGSRGQQRASVLAVKLAQAEYSKIQTGEYPIMLLDDVLSELDIEHRRKLLEIISVLPQIFITTTDISTIDASFLARAVPFKVIKGNIQPENNP